MQNELFPSQITKEELENLPVKSFEGKIVLVDNLVMLSKAVIALQGHHVLGFDTETKPCFQRGQSNKVALLQLSTPELAFLFRLHQIGLPHSLSRILADPKILKIGAAVHDDIKGLQKIGHFHPASFVDLQSMMKNFNIEAMGLRKMTAIILGFGISKKQQLSNWEQQVLTEAQQKYAATDAWVCLEIYKKLYPHPEEHHLFED
jgi:ribonuclease D